MHGNSPISITQQFIRAHMEKRNLEDALSCLTDTVEWFGTGAFEIAHGKKEARQFLMAEIRGFPEGYTIAFEDMTEKFLTENSGTVFGKMLVTDHAMESQIDCRVTTTCVKYEGGFLIASLHMSLPTTLQNDSEYYPLTIASKKIQQLKDDFFNTTIPGGLICRSANNGFELRYVNDFFITLLGYENKDDFMSATHGFFINCLCYDEDIAEMERDVQAMEIDEHHTFTYRVKKKYGGEIWLREYTRKYDDNGSFDLLGFCMDISDIIQMENELKKQKNQLEFANAEIQTIISNVPGGVHRCRLFDRICVDYVSRGFEEMAGYTKDEIHRLFNDNYTMMLIEEDRKIFSNAVCKLSLEPGDMVIEYRMRRKDGAIIKVEDHFRSVRMEDGKMWGFGVATDVTSKYETQAQLKLLTDSIPGGLAVYEYSQFGIDTIYFSDGVCDMIGYTRDEYAKIAKTGLADMVFEEDIDKIRQKINRVVIGDTNIDCVYRIRTRSGGYRWLNLRGAVTFRQADLIRINAVLLDITESKESEEKLRIRDEEYRLAIKQSGKLVYRYTIADKSIYMLQNMTDSFNFPRSAKNIPDSIIALNFIAAESVNDFVDFYKAINRGEKSGSVVLRRKLNNGGFGWCRACFTALFNSTGEPVSAIISIEDITKQHEQALENEALRQNEELFQIVLSHSDRFIVKYDIPTLTAYIQRRTAVAFSVGEILHDVPYGCVKRGGIAEESTQAYIDFYEKMIGGQATARANIKMRRNAKQDKLGWYRFDGSVIFDDKKRPIYAVVSFVEVTEQYEKELAYERMNQHINRLSTDAMLYFEANLTEMKIERAGGCRLRSINSNLYGDPKLLLETKINEMVYPEDMEIIRCFFDKNNLLTDFANGKTEKEIEIRILENNEPKWVCATVEMINDPYTENVLVYILFKDIDESKTKEIRMLKQAESDGLTALYNRAAIELQIKQILEEKQNRSYAFIIVDVDDLKIVNDTLGHIEGDRAIKAFACTLLSSFDGHALVGRIGGDEFIAFLQNIESRKKLNDIIQKLVHKLADLRAGENDEYHLHGSIGIAIACLEDESFETLYKKADTALYYVKRHGKNSYAFYSKNMEDKE